jgi:hypothetical protein
MYSMKQKSQILNSIRIQIWGFFCTENPYQCCGSESDRIRSNLELLAGSGNNNFGTRSEQHN